MKKRVFNFIRWIRPILILECVWTQWKCLQLLLWKWWPTMLRRVTAPRPKICCTNSAIEIKVKIYKNSHSSFDWTNHINGSQTTSCHLAMRLNAWWVSEVEIQYSRTLKNLWFAWHQSERKSMNLHKNIFAAHLEIEDYLRFSFNCESCLSIFDRVFTIYHELDSLCVATCEKKRVTNLRQSSAWMVGMSIVWK